MKDPLSRLADLRRPPLLIRAARIAADEYRRDYHLARLLGGSAPSRSGQAILQLMEVEDMTNRQRKQADAGYSVIRHLEILSALVGEARLLQAAN